MIGNKILNYEIISLIGEGGMGNVYLAEHTQVKRKVAVKVLLPQFMKNEEIKQRFKKEASTLAHLQHPNIVGLFDYLEDENGMYLIMEYVKGMQLDDYIQNVSGPLQEEKAIPVIKQILEAFEYAHKKGVVHRDIKPSNILISDNDEVKILDFGIARIIGEEGHNLTKTGVQMGTVFYMSPEQVQGKKVDKLSDVYSLGVTFYQLLTGINPYKGTTTEYEIFNKIVKEELPDPQEIYPGIPDYLSNILKKALQKDPKDRFQSCAEFLEAILSKTQVKVAVKSMPIISNSHNQSAPKNTSSTKKTNGIAIAGLIIGILSVLLSFIPIIGFGALILAILGLIFSTKGYNKSNNHEDFKKSKGSAIGGIIFSILGLILSLVFSGIYLFSVFMVDTDGDGIIDRKDKCPLEYGVLDGCPDSDGDGTLDSQDNCPDMAGLPANGGCPDEDGDGVFDDVDECITEEGDKDNNGCPWPDDDGDGIPNQDDKCPAEWGEVTNNGCPLLQTKCPDCNFITQQNQTNFWLTCPSCSAQFYSCKRTGDQYYGIASNWLNDGACDCMGCEDEQ